MDTKSRKEIRIRLTVTYTLLILAFGVFAVLAVNVGAMVIFDRNPAFDLPLALLEDVEEVQPVIGFRGRQLFLDTLDAREAFRETYNAFIDAEQENLTQLRNISLLTLIPYTILSALIGYQIADKILKPQEKAMDKQKQFVADASHELKTPLTKIQTNIDVIIDRAVAGKVEKEEYTETLNLISSFNKEMTELTEDLLLLSNTEKSNLAETSINAIVEEIIDQYSEDAEKKGLKISFSTKKKVIKKVNKNLFKRAVGNLVQNAIRYSDNGEIKISLTSDKLVVKDQGIGIPKDKLTSIFERFYRVDKSRSRKEGGSGLGLSIVKKIIEEHGFSIKAESELKKGSTFTIHF